MNSDLHARAKSVFLRAVDLPASEREPFIERECGGDAALHAEIASLLAHHHAETLIAAPSATSRPNADETVSPDGGAGSSLVGRAVSAVGRLRPHGQLALGAVVAMLLLAVVGGWVHRNTEATLRHILGEKLRGMLDADVAAVELWIESKKASVREWSADRTLRDAVEELLRTDATRSDAARRLRAAPPQATLRAALDGLAQAEPAYLLWDRTQTVIADSSPDAPALAGIATPLGAKLLSYVYHGETILCIERPAEPLVRAASPPADDPLLTIISPIESDDDRIVAALMIRDIDRDGELERILGHVYTGETGECYAFDREGLMLSESRFNDVLARIGLIPASANARSATVVSLRDPGGDLTAGYRPKRPLAACPLTNMAAHAVAG
ncbi:MAG: hypothetical protein B7Z73_09230, partial [Planctomycetia bacterium 21-64-5]